jgi:hypothetical protein
LSTANMQPLVRFVLDTNEKEIKMSNKLTKLMMIGTGLAFGLSVNASFSPATATETGGKIILAAGSGHGSGGDQGSGSGQGSGGQGSGSGQGSGGQGSGSGQGSGGKGSGQSEGKGKSDDKGGNSARGKPSWAGKELVDIGRLNVARSPDMVLDLALANLLLEYEAAVLSGIYSGTLESFIANLDLEKMIDSPLQNLAVLRDYWVDDVVSLPGVTASSYIDFSAMLIGAAADKNITITSDMIGALATIFDVNMDEATAQAIADKADDLREAIVTIHG